MMNFVQIFRLIFRPGFIYLGLEVVHINRSANEAKTNSQFLRILNLILRLSMDRPEPRSFKFVKTLRESSLWVLLKNYFVFVSLLLDEKRTCFFPLITERNLSCFCTHNHMANQNKLRASDLKFLKGKLSLSRSQIPRDYLKKNAYLYMFVYFYIEKSTWFFVIERREIYAFSRERIFFFLSRDL